MKMRNGRYLGIRLLLLGFCFLAFTSLLQLHGLHALFDLGRFLARSLLLPFSLFFLLLTAQSSTLRGVMHRGLAHFLDVHDGARSLLRIDRGWGCLTVYSWCVRFGGGESAGW